MAISQPMNVSVLHPSIACRESSITHKLTKPYHPWTNGQAERMNRTVQDAAGRAFHYPRQPKGPPRCFHHHLQLRKHLKSLRWRTPFPAICDAWTKDPTPFIINPRHLITGPHSQAPPLDIAGPPAGKDD